MDSNLTELIPMAMDYFLQDNKLPELATPVATIGKSIYEKITSIKQNRFNDKLYIFLTETAKATDKERIQFLERLGGDNKKFWEDVLVHLDNIDSQEKAAITGKLSHALILKYIDLDKIFRLNLIIKNTYVKDLVFLHENYSKNQNEIEKANNKFLPFDIDGESKTIIHNLVNIGLLRSQSTGMLQHAMERSRAGYSKTELGALLLKYGF